MKDCYRPQTKFAKVMFLHVTVCPQGGGSTWAGTPLAGTPPWQVHPPGRYTPSGQVPSPLAGTPPGRYTPQANTTPTPSPGVVHAGRYGQQACGTHPTGMHSCFN